MTRLCLLYLYQSFRDGFNDCYSNYINWHILIFEFDSKHLIGISEIDRYQYFWYWLNDGSLSFKQWLYSKGFLKGL